MQVLCLDIGSTTQDVLLFDTAASIENAVQMVLPSPTLLTAKRIETATTRGDDIVLTGDTMGGGASTAAVRRHLESGRKVYATENAACTFSDDLEEVASWGIQLVPNDEVDGKFQGTVIPMADVDIRGLRKALSNWNVVLDPDIVAVAVLDHGTAPPGESDRLWRFRYLEQLLTNKATIEAFMFSGEEIPRHFSRMKAVARGFKENVPLVIMDTGAAAVMGASLDRNVALHENLLAVNAGNSHTIAFNLCGPRVLGFFEHHTSLLSRDRLESLLLGIIAGELEGRDIREEGGHGSLILEQGEAPFLAVTGPRRALLESSRLDPYFVSPFGSMMLAGCYGLLKAAATKLPSRRGEIEEALSR